MSAPPPVRRPAPRASFTPRFSLSLIYLFGFFSLYCVLLLAPVFYDALQSLPEYAGPEAEQALTDALGESVKRALEKRLWISVAASVFTTVLGAHFRILPGLREG